MNYLNRLINLPSKARAAFDANLKDVEALLKLHTVTGGSSPGRRYGLEVLNRSAIVLITSYWEAYCEDIAEEALEIIVNHAPTADFLPKEIKKIIAKKLKDDRNELAIWNISDDKWRNVLKDNLLELKNERNKNLNTPKHYNIDKLFETTIGLPDISKKWIWAKKLTVPKAQEKLNKFVALRGDIAHRGKSNVSVTKANVQDYLEFVKKAAAKTGGAINRHVRDITGTNLF